MQVRPVRLLLTILLLGTMAVAQSTLDPTQRLARDILQELVAIPSTQSREGSTPAAQAVAARLLAAGFPASDVHVIGPNPRKQNLVARLRGTGAGKPILFLAHLDVVEAPRADWSTDPFQLVERNGNFYGRGVYDVKQGAAILASNFIRWKQEDLRPQRDLILALTADEEDGNDNGVQWLLKNHRELIDAAYCLNTDAGDFLLENGRPLLASIEVSEKWYVDWKLQVINPGGHSSRPRKDNAIYQLAAALLRIQQLQFPMQLNEVTRAYFEKEAGLVGGSLANDMRRAASESPDPAAIARLSENPFYNALLRTTCVATMVQAGHAVNALPQVATANVNCRVLPQMKLEEVQKALLEAIVDPQISLSLVEQPFAGPASPLEPQITLAVERVVNQMWPGLPVVPFMETGASDGKWLRHEGIAVYSISPVFIDPTKQTGHGKDEYIGVKEFYQGVDFYNRLVRELAGI